jgi:hypothetical protein
MSTPTPANPLAEFGAVPVDSALSNTNTNTAPPVASQSNPLAEFGAIPIPDDKPHQPNAYERATASDPFVPAGAAERAMGEEIGDNKAQAKEALRDTLRATAETVAGVTGAGPAAEALSGAGAAGAAGKEMLTQLAKEYPKAAKVVGAYTSWLAVHMAHKMGIPLPKILEVIGE